MNFLSLTLEDVISQANLREPQLKSSGWGGGMCMCVGGWWFVRMKGRQSRTEFARGGISVVWADDLEPLGQIGRAQQIKHGR